MKKRLLSLLIHPLFIAIFLFAIIFIIAAYMPMNCDEGVWHYIGRVWTQYGIPPYISAVENKTPGIFELYAISYKYFGLNLIFVRLLGMIALVFSALIVYKIATKIHSKEAAVFAMYVFGLTNTWGMFSGGFISHTETFMLLFSTFSIWILINVLDDRNRIFSMFLAGISMGIAIAFKQIAITTAFAAVLFCVFYPKKNLISRKITSVLLFVAGIFTATLISIFPILLSGATFKNYIDGAWLILLNSASNASLTAHFADFVNVLILSRIAFLFSFLMLIFRFKFLLKDVFFIGLLLWFAFDFLGVNASGHYYGHQIKQMMPSFAIIIGILFSELLKKLSSSKSYKINYQLGMILFVIFSFLPYGGLGKGAICFLNRNKMDDDKKLGIWLNNNTLQNETVFIEADFHSNVLAYSERFSASKYINTIFLTTEKERTELLNDLKKNKPIYIVKCNFDLIKDSTAGEKVDDYIRSNYVIEERKTEYDILKRK
ncbi:MAG: glycosyltransferase family 39 protein [Paludibacter sp.]|nr:glycosyltransferase family 39 protein [Paludibacter sp.]